MGTNIFPDSSPMSCAMLTPFWVDAVTTLAISCKEETWVCLYFLFTSPKHQSGANCVCMSHQEEGECHLRLAMTSTEASNCSCSAQNNCQHSTEDAVPLCHRFLGSDECSWGLHLPPFHNSHPHQPGNLPASANLLQVPQFASSLEPICTASLKFLLDVKPP